MKKERSDKLRIQGSRIKKFREAKGLTQKELATICGYAEPTTIFKIEKGLQELPDDRMAALCRSLDFGGVIIFGGTTKGTRHKKRGTQMRPSGDKKI